MTLVISANLWMINTYFYLIYFVLSDPSLTETGTTETQLDPENFHVPDLNEEIDNKGENMRPSYTQHRI